ncbi:MAG: hypothetical protein PVG78_16865 [Desulfobacterales bacterium]|jgi:hypothetical protein
MKNPFLTRWLETLFRIFPERSGVPDFFTRLFSGRLRRQIEEKVTDDLMWLLLCLLRLAFVFSKGFRKNIEGFEGRYVFAAESSGSGSPVVESAIFANGRLHQERNAIDDYHVKVSFSDHQALRRYLLAPDQDILDLMLENKVTVEGNVNYIYKFLFMTKDLFRRVGIG